MSEFQGDHCGKQLSREPQAAEGTAGMSGSIAAAAVTTEPDGRFPVAMVASFAASALGGLFWAAMVYHTDSELGIIAWGVGVLAAVAVTKFTRERSRRLGITSAALVLIGLLLGLLLGNLLIVQWVGVRDLSDMIAANIAHSAPETALNDPNTMFQIASNKLVAQGSLEDDLASSMKLHYAGIVPEEPSAEVKAGIDKVLVFLAGLTDSEKEIMVREHNQKMAGQSKQVAQQIINSLSVTNRIEMMHSNRHSHSYWAVLSYWDALWLFLAVTTAYKIAAGKG